MKANHDFSGAKRGAVVSAKGKTRITIWVDDAVLDIFRARAQKEGKGYQTAINEALRATALEADDPLTMTNIRRAIREELRAA